MRQARRPGPSGNFSLKCTAAFLVMTPAGSVLWDCVSFLDHATTEIVRAFGGIQAIALSHPHFYGAMASWGRTFDCPVLVHEADRNWVVEPDAIRRLG